MSEIHTSVYYIWQAVVMVDMYDASKPNIAFARVEGGEQLPHGSTAFSGLHNFVHLINIVFQSFFQYLSRCENLTRASFSNICVYLFHMDMVEMDRHVLKSIFLSLTWLPHLHGQDSSTTFCWQSKSKLNSLHVDQWPNVCCIDSWGRTSSSVWCRWCGSDGHNQEF